MIFWNKLLDIAGLKMNNFFKVYGAIQGIIGPIDHDKCKIHLNAMNSTKTAARLTDLIQKSGRTESKRVYSKVKLDRSKQIDGLKLE